MGVLLDEQDTERVVKKFGLPVIDVPDRAIMILARLEGRNDVSLRLQKMTKRRLDKFRKTLNSQSFSQMFNEMRQGDFSEAPLAG